jgi:hypothetical protein
MSPYFICVDMVLSSFPVNSAEDSTCVSSTSGASSVAVSAPAQGKPFYFVKNFVHINSDPTSCSNEKAGIPEVHYPSATRLEMRSCGFPYDGKPRSAPPVSHYVLLFLFSSAKIRFVPALTTLMM